MSRRQLQAEQEFGSDSFLDVIANIVGILIILTVLVGLRVARQVPEESVTATKASVTTEATEPAVVTIPTEAGPPAEPDPALSRQLAELRNEVSLSQQQLAALNAQSETAEAELSAARASLARARSETETVLAELDALRSDLSVERTAAERRSLRASATAAQISATEIRVASLTTETTQSEERLQVVLKNLSNVTDAQHAAEAGLRDVITETQQLTETLKSLEETEVPGDRLQHRLAPVGQIVADEEMHFRIDRGRVSYVPLPELLQELKRQLHARTSIVLKFGRTEGIVGPVDGYFMNYTAASEGGTTLQAIQEGHVMQYVRVTRWTITPADRVPAETSEQALASGSRFRQKLEAAPLDSTVTFWIYPDSFDAFPQLRELAHGLDLRVAARPLPPGTPIIGSPRGSTSTSQ